MSLTLYNTLTRKKETFIPLNSEKVTMYVCGPTVYDRAHLGNARPVVAFDILYRLLKYFYPEVLYVRNITDVDDKINESSKEKGISILDLTNSTIAHYHQDMKALNALKPDLEPLATHHIPQMITMISTLLKKGFAYESQGHVLFDVEKFSAYGKLSQKNQAELLAGARIEVSPYKKHAQDFVLWKPSSTDLPGWESPWGRGRPGWHIECSAMSTQYLGAVFDIHAGGIDLVFPHHENEIAQSCSFHNTDIMAKYWLHNGHLTVLNHKMSKSLGNFLTVQDLLQEYKGETIRLALLMSHYRQPLDWTESNLTQAKQILDRWYKLIDHYSLEDHLPNPQESLIGDNFLKALEDDLNTPQAITEIHALYNQLQKTDDAQRKLLLAKKIFNSGKFLGLLQMTPKIWFEEHQEQPLSTEIIEDLIYKRQMARKERNFSKADSIRNELFTKGILLEDKGEVTLWRLA